MTNVDCTDIDMVIVHKGEGHENDLNPYFKSIEKKMSVLCSNDVHALLKFSVKQYEQSNDQNHKLYGFFTSTLDILARNPTASYVLHDKNGKPTANILKFHQITIMEKPSFM